jgi:hypothetical protein
VDAAASSRKAIAGRIQTRERSTDAQDERRFLRTAKPCGPGTRCWCQVRGGFVSPTGSGKTVNPLTTVTRRIRRRGERGISRKAIAQGMPECSDCTCMLVCVSLCMFAHETAGAASTRHSLLPLFLGAKDSCMTRANRAAGSRNPACAEPRQALWILAHDRDASVIAARAASARRSRSQARPQARQGSGAGRSPLRVAGPYWSARRRKKTSAGVRPGSGRHR